MSEAGHAFAAMASTFLTGSAGGLAVCVGAAWLNPAAASLVLDWFGEGLGAFDALFAAWFVGHVALIVHHILPGIARA